MDLVIEIIVVLSGTIFIAIAVHRFLFYHGIIHFEFNRVDRIKKLFTISFITHMVSIVAFIISNI